jgi:hypothetical protein
MLPSSLCFLMFAVVCPTFAVPCPARGAADPTVQARHPAAAGSADAKARRAASRDLRLAINRDDLSRVRVNTKRLGDDFLRREPRVLDMAARDCGPATVRFLLRHGASVRAADSRGWTALMQVQRPDVARLLLARGADPNARDRSGMTVLMHAADSDASVATVRALLAAGARRADKDRSGRTAFDYALRCEVPSIAEIVRMEFRVPARERVSGSRVTYGDPRLAAILRVPAGKVPGRADPRATGRK